MDSPRQVSTRRPSGICRLAEEAAKSCESIENLVMSLYPVGVPTVHMPLPLENGRATVLGHTYDYVEYVSLHTLL